jgi:membrane-associated phospholipid phosphatase
MPELSIRTLIRPYPLVRVDLRPAEWIGFVYFLYAATLCAVNGVALPAFALAVCVPGVIYAVAAVETLHSRPSSRVFRALFPTLLILVAYWQLDWFRAPPLEHLQQSWVALDRQLLEHLGFRRIIESLGSLGPMVLDTSYLLLYAIPPLTVTLLIAFGHGNRVDRFLTTVLLGTFAAFALLPHFPSVAPRIAFPLDQLPTIQTTVRRLNLFLLDRMDISTSVFPSGHVAVAFSSAWGLWRALPERRWVAGLLVFYACLVFLATVYDRYHYAADGIASVVLSVAAWRLSKLCDRTH